MPNFFGQIKADFFSFLLASLQVEIKHKEGSLYGKKR